MNFFERQDEARRHSRILSWLFAAAVIAIVVAVDSVASVTWVIWRTWEGYHRHALAHVPGSFHTTVIGITLLLILVVSSVKSMQLRAGGGAAVARMLGGRPIGRGTEDPYEKRLLNVVEEMAIASGTRVPLVFVLDRQKGINALTAGHDVSHAAIAVTRGALEDLTRDELQGVIAHEFSHIVNGDTALNIRMVGLLSGIVWIGALGQFAMRAAARAEDVRALPVAVVGFFVWAIGSVGLLCSRAIKSMLSRERELLADASGVQFTRNPEGLAGALDQIRKGYSWVASPHTENVSHLFFADAHGFLSGLFFATHPPIEERIRRVDPRFSAEDYRRKRAAAADAAAVTPRPFDEVVASSEANAIPWQLTATDAVALVGAVQAPHLEDARAGLRGLAPGLREALDDRRRAAGVVVAMLLERQADAAAAGLQALEQGRFAELASAVKDALPLVQTVVPERELAVVDLALPVLRVMSQADRMELLRALQAVLGAQQKVSIHAFAFATFVRSQLERRPPPSPSSYCSLSKARDDAAVLISLVAHAGCGEPETLERDFLRAFEAGCVESGLVGQVSAVRRDECTPEAASLALSRLRDLAPLDKARLVKGLFAAITADGVIRPIEAALMRMVGGVLDCPLPPLTLDAQARTAARAVPAAAAA